MGFLLEQIKERLTSDPRFYFHGKGNNEGQWGTNKKGEPVYSTTIDLKKALAQKGFGGFTIRVYKEDVQGVEMKIEMYVPSCGGEDTVFEGFLETLEDYDHIFRMLGLN